MSGCSPYPLLHILSVRTDSISRNPVLLATPQFLEKLAGLAYRPYLLLNGAAYLVSIVEDRPGVVIYGVSGHLCDARYLVILL